MGGKWESEVAHNRVYVYIITRLSKVSLRQSLLQIGGKHKYICQLVKYSKCTKLLKHK